MRVLFRVSEFMDLKPVEFEVLSDEDEIAERYHKIKKGAVFSKFNIMTQMLVLTLDGEILIKSLIYEIAENTIKIKGKIHIPISSIKEVTYEYQHYKE